jgi:hypothetical protein
MECVMVGVWGKVAGFLAAPALDAGKGLYGKYKSHQAIKDLFLRRVIGDDGLVQEQDLGKPIDAVGLTFTITPLPAISKWPYRYYVEVIRNEEKGDSPNRVTTFYFSCDSEGKSTFNRT